MTPSEIKTAILASNELKQLAYVGRDNEIARLLSQETTKADVRVNSLKILDKFGPVRGTAINAAFRALKDDQDCGAVVTELLKHFDTNGDNVGINVGHSSAPTLFATFVTKGVVTQQESDAILDMANVKKNVTADEVADVINSEWRPNGIAGEMEIA